MLNQVHWPLRRMPEAQQRGPAVPVLATLASTAASATAAVGTTVASGVTATGSFLTGSSLAASSAVPAAETAAAATGIETASLPAASAATNFGVGATALSTAGAIGAQLLAKPPSIPNAPQSPNISSAFLQNNQNVAAKAALGGTYLTQGQQVGSTQAGGGKSLLGQ